jgi:hypothetical protein
MNTAPGIYSSQEDESAASLTSEHQVRGHSLAQRHRRNSTLSIRSEEIATAHGSDLQARRSEPGLIFDPKINSSMLLGTTCGAGQSACPEENS